MARNVDLTGKIGIGGRPTITCGDVVLTVNDGAANLLRVLKMLQDDPSVENVMDAAGFLFDDESKKALDGMALSFDDYATVIQTAVDLIMGDAEGKAETPATT